MMDTKKVEAGNRALQNHQRAVQAVKQQSVSRLGSKPTELPKGTIQALFGLNQEMLTAQEAAHVRRKKKD